MDINLEVGSDVIRSYKRLSYKHWYALAEFVDNSTQSYFNNREVLDKDYTKNNDKLTVTITYDRDNNWLRVTDNAMGMSLEELQLALKLGRSPTVEQSRSQYGLGMKTSALWLGDTWEIATTKLGDDQEHTVLIDLEKIAGGDTKLEVVTTPANPQTHRTVITIKTLRNPIHGRTIGKIKDFLASMYRIDIRENVLDLYWYGSKLEWDTRQEFVRDPSGLPYKKEFSFNVEGKEVKGWIGVLAEGYSGRPKAGFSVFRFNRMIKGFPNTYRPTTIFGQLSGTNDVVNQRLTGELFVDEFDVTHTKDDIHFNGVEEDEFENKLREIADDYIHVAKNRKQITEGNAASETEIQAALDEIEAEMKSNEFMDALTTEELPADVIEAVDEPVITVTQTEEPRVSVELENKLSIKIYMSKDPSPNDPYYAYTRNGNVIHVVINTSHPYYISLQDADTVTGFIRYCVYDALSEDKCVHLRSPINPSTMKSIKDRLLRVPREIDENMTLTTIEAPVEN